MGIYDREYYRKEGPSYLESLIPRGQVCKWLIGINILVFVLQLITKPTPQDFRQIDAHRKGAQTIQVPESRWGPISDSLDLATDKVTEGQVWRLLTYSFLHSPTTLWHILFNMLFLWWFGSAIEELYGSREFLAFYLVSALLGGIAFQLQALVQGTPMYSVGASGAVTAVLVLYAFHFPHTTILLFFFLPVPIWLLVIFQVGQDALQLINRTQTDTAVAVHLGGAAFAFLYYKFHWRLTPLWQGLQGWRGRRSKPRLRVYHPEEELRVPVATGPADVDEHLDAKLDAVLEKLSRHGRESLTESERDILVRASEIYKKKRN
jgi:membrane associated rhomboid family serine protease